MPTINWLVIPVAVLALIAVAGRWYFFRSADRFWKLAAAHPDDAIKRTIFIRRMEIASVQARVTQKIRSVHPKGR